MKTRFITPFACLSALFISLSAPAGVFIDDFDRATTPIQTAGTTNAIGMEYTIVSGQWSITDTDTAGRIPNQLYCWESGVMLYEGARTLRDGDNQFTLSADVWSRSYGADRRQGLVFNYQDAANYYVFDFVVTAEGRGTIRLGKMQDGRFTLLAQETGAIAIDRYFYYTMQVQADPASITARMTSVGGATVFFNHTVGDVSLTNGYAGFWKQGANNSAYDNFSIETTNTDGGGLYVAREMVVDTVWAGHDVDFATITGGGYQFAGYYNAERQMVIARRKVGSDQWQYKKLPTHIGWDSHNYITMTLDSDNILHVAGNMHVVPLIYFRATKPFDVESLEQVSQMVGTRENRVTYPRFIKLADGRTLFRYRDGTSGDGADLYNVYNEQTRTWSRLTDTPMVDGQGLRNAYVQLPELGEDGYYHLAWVWRDTIDAATNHNLSYARTRDFLNWEDAHGNPLTLPITLAHSSTIVDPIPIHGGILNGSGKVGFDTQGRVAITYFKFDQNGYTQIYVARIENGAWARHKVTDWEYRWEFGGGGTLPSSDVAHNAVYVGEDGQLRLYVRHVRYGRKKLILSETDFSILGEEPSSQPWEALVAPHRKVRSAFPGMGSRQMTGGVAPDGTPGYVLLWESLGNNRDQPRPEPWPAAAPLRLIELARTKGDEPKIAEGAWTMALLPDTQFYAQDWPSVFLEQTAWLRDNARRYNIRHVFHLGDIVNVNSPEQWQTARAAMRVLDGHLPYALATGNRDYGAGGSAASRLTYLNHFFEYDVLRRQRTFGGSMESGKIDNTYHLFSAGGYNWIVLALEWAPRDSVIDWADSVLTQYANRRAILVTHAYLNGTNRRYDVADAIRPQLRNPHSYGTMGGVNDGEQLWQKLVKKHNVMLVLSGHSDGSGAAYRSDKNDRGVRVHQLMANFQELQPMGGSGYLVLLVVNPDGMVEARAYSPMLDSTDSAVQEALSFNFAWYAPVSSTGGSMADYYSPDLDSDGDGISNYDEFVRYGTDPYLVDSDNDGIPDHIELLIGTDPAVSDAVALNALLANASLFGLYSEEAILDLNVGRLMIRAEDTGYRLLLQLEASDSLGAEPFVPVGAPLEWTLQSTDNKVFMRVRVAD